MSFRRKEGQLVISSLGE